VGYDAYCVCGYATQDVALLNQIRKTCPLLEEKEEVEDSGVCPLGSLLSSNWSTSFHKYCPWYLKFGCNSGTHFIPTMY